MIRSTIASRFQRAKTMGIFWGILALALQIWPFAPVVRAQGSRKDDIVFNSRGVPLAGATIRVCTMPATGQPCTPLALIYSDSALTQALANPTTSDGLGNYHFYAAPGRYMIEISGPGITTKQIPDVLIPADPTSPTFTGNISAFSLNLSGNLTVNGNTTVLGNLASGTLNLTDQSTPPGTASAGTVNLYVKSSDKRLYYKDDTGTEIGPISSASGAQTNVTNTFTAPQNVDADLHVKGPNPMIDLARYGAYYSTLPFPTTTGSITAGGTTLTLASAQDFANGQGVVVWGAGALPTISTPPAPTVTPTGILNGSTTYSYQVIAEDYYGGLTTASAAGSTTVGAANLGINTITLTSATRTSGVVTYTSSVNHNIQAGSTVAICQFGGGAGCPGSFFDLFNSVKTVVSTPTGTTFTVNDASGYGDATDTSGTPIAEVLACNKLTFSTFSGVGTLRYWIYRSKSGGAYSLVGVAVGLDPFFVDCGTSTPVAPGYVPATPPGAAQAGYLSTTITSGGGTTSLTLANAATTTVSTATVQHDNTPALRAAIQAAFNVAGATIYFPASTVSPSQTYYPFNSTLDMTSGFTNAGNYPTHIQVNAYVSLAQPWILRANTDIEGLPKKSTSYLYVLGAYFGGTAYPMFYIGRSSGTSIHLQRLMIGLSSPQQIGVFSDLWTDGGGFVGFVADDVEIGGNGGLSRPWVLKGGYDYFFNRGNCDPGGAQVLITPPCVELTDSSTAVTGANTPQVPGRVYFNYTYFTGTGVQIDSIPNSTNLATSSFGFHGSLFESGWGPFLRIMSSNMLLDAVDLTDVVGADLGAGAATPIIDATGSNLRVVTWSGGGAANSSQPLLISTAPGATLSVNHPPSFYNGNSNWFSIGPGYAEANNQVVSAFNGGKLIYRLSTPAAPTATVSSGGNVAVGTYTYTVSAADSDGNETLVSPSVSATTTAGNQTVTITAPVFPAGTVGWYVYRNGARALINNVSGSCTVPMPVAVTQFVDSYATICAQSSASVPSAGSSILGPNGISSWKYLLNTNALNSPAGVTGKTWTFADHNTQYAPATAKPSSNIGFTLETGIPQSAFDNFNRTNGAIGGNWTLQTGGFNVSSNVLVGTGSTNNWAYYSAPSAVFSADQFAEITLPTPIPSGGGAGPGVRMAGTGSSANNYNCHPNNTTLYLERILNGSSAILASVANTSAAGDVIRLEAAGNTLNCYYNGVLKLTATDSNLVSGSPGIELYNTAATLDNWTAGNLLPLAHTSAEQDFSQVQHFPFGLTVGPLSLASTPPTGITMGAESFNSVPRAFLSAFLPGALTATWTGSTITLDKAITVTRVQVQAKTAPAGCTTNAVVRLTDGTTPVNVTLSAGANDSGAISQNYAAGAALTIGVQTAAAGCTTAPADANVAVQYKMQ
jgi:hypothetical protein